MPSSRFGQIVASIAAVIVRVGCEVDGGTQIVVEVFGSEQTHLAGSGSRLSKGFVAQISPIQ